MNVLITAALPYANGSIHFGHIAGVYLPADCYARFMRQQGNEVLFLSGSDEYGVAVTMSAEKAGRTPQEQVEIFHKINKALFHKLSVSFDHYSRTTWEGHEKPVVEFFQDLYDNGYIEKRETEQLYSEKDNQFLADRYVEGICPKCGFAEARGDECPSCSASYEAPELGKPRSKMTGAPLILKKTSHYFLLFDKFKERLTEWLETKDWKPNVVNFVKKYVEDLKPRAISRDAKWGIPVPLKEAEGKVLYVWFDAPIGYISAAMEWARSKGDEEAWKKFWMEESTKLVHFLGKDNIPFHTIFFPAMLMGQNKPYKLPDDVPANEFLNLEGKQFSKSSGWYIDIDDFFTHFTPDQIRYYLAANAPESHDSEFTWDDFQMRCNAELVGKFGNFVNRVLVFARNNCEQQVPKLDNLTEEMQSFVASVDELMEDIKHAFGSYKVRQASNLLMELAQKGNVFFDAMKPWVLAKNPESKETLYSTIACCLYCAKALALASSPIIPHTAQKLWELLGYKGMLTSERWDDLVDTAVPPKQKLQTPEVLFQKVEPSLIEEQKQKLAKPMPTHEPIKETITFDDFSKLDLRTGTIIECEKVKKSKKLLRLIVDLGFEKRQVVSGIALTYPDPEKLIGERVILVANLKKAKLMGIESEGMILCAEDANGLTLARAPFTEDGSPVT